MTDPYKILGVPRTASKEDIKTAYKKLAKKYHPDVGGDAVKFAEITSAYEKLQNLQHSPYDGMSSTYTNWGFGSYMPDDVYRSAFNFDNVVKNKDIRVTYYVELEDVAMCATKNLNVSLPDGDSKLVTVEIPAGIRDGSKVRYPNFGTLRSGAPAGDLIVTFLFKPHNTFKVEESNLVLPLNISVVEAMSGIDKVITTLDNRTLKLKISAGTQPGTRLRIPESGLPRKNLPNGDLFIEISVKIPKISLSDLDLPIRSLSTID